MAGQTTDLDALRRDINREIERLASDAGTKAMNGAPANAEVDRIKELQAVLAALPHKESFPLRWAAIVGTVCLVGASLTWTIAIPRARVQLNLTAASIILQLTDDFPWDGNWQVDSPVRLLQFTHLDLPPEYGIPEALEKEASLELNVTQGTVRVRHLFIAQGAWSTIASGESGRTDMVVHGAPFRGDIDISGVVSARAGPALGTSLPLQTFDPDTPPGRFGFQYDGRSALPALLHVSLVDDKLSLREIPVSALSFFEERADGTHGSAFTSQIISGTVTMTDTGEHIMLAPSAALRLTDAHGLVSTLQVTRKDIQVKFEGTASDVTLGTGDFARSLKPTILEWLFHQQKLGFFWGAITFLWGFAWSARRLYSGNM